MAFAFGDPLGEEDAYHVERVMLAERFGWTFEYIDHMDFWDRRRAVLILDAKDRARAARQSR